MLLWKVRERDIIGNTVPENMVAAEKGLPVHQASKRSESQSGKSGRAPRVSGVAVKPVAGSGLCGLVGA
jgi:hypothetical protein